MAIGRVKRIWGEEPEEQQVGEQPALPGEEEATLKKTFSDKIALIIATGFGLGYSPIASGTVGTLPGVLIALLMNPLHWGLQVALCVLLTLVAVPFCDRAEKILGRKDDGRIVADEYLTFPICVIGLPMAEYPWLIPAAFLVARFTDIVKIPPAAQSQNIKGGVGIVLDDAIANVYALILLHAGFHLFQRFMG
ncbi:MAG: phosphatidylglycerophosphatase A [Verrucomicrobiota bacterium]